MACSRCGQSHAGFCPPKARRGSSIDSNPQIKGMDELFLGSREDGRSRRRNTLTGPIGGWEAPPAPGTRFNAFYNDRSENENIAPVVFRQKTATSSVGWSERGLFENLGHFANDGDARRAEQEYLLLNMVKGAMSDAARIATDHNVGIAVRGTGKLAHMGIELGNPTKAQEIKNKTSKDIDLFLCDQLDWIDVGAVLHYDPRVGWAPERGAAWKTTGAPTERDWEAKRRHIERTRIPELQSKLGQRMKFPTTEDQWKPIHDLFMDRVKEYHEEDPEFRGAGHYARHVTMVGPFIRLKTRPEDNIYGDHDLFCFTRGEYGNIAGFPSADIRGSMKQADLFDVQMDLQLADNFQAQHGAIWYWKPEQEFHKKIKQKIMGAHSPPHGDPLVYIRPDGEITAAFYIPGDERVGIADRLAPVWSWFPTATKWLESTYSGAEVLRKIK